MPRAMRLIYFSKLLKVLLRKSSFLTVVGSFVMFLKSVVFHIQKAGTCQRQRVESHEEFLFFPWRNYKFIKTFVLWIWNFRFSCVEILFFIFFFNVFSLGQSEFIQELVDEEFRKVVDEHSFMVVEFYAHWW